MRRPWLNVGNGLSLLVGTYLVAAYFAFACSDNAYPGTTRGDVCHAVGDPDGILWWVAALWPATLFGASRFIPWMRQHGVITALATALLAVAFWVPLYNAISV